MCLSLVLAVLVPRFKVQSNVVHLSKHLVLVMKLLNNDTGKETAIRMSARFITLDLISLNMCNLEWKIKPIIIE